MRALPMICVALVALACAATYVVNSTVDLSDGDPTRWGVRLVAAASARSARCAPP